MVTPEDQFESPILSDEQIKKFFQRMQARDPSRVEKRQQVATREYGAWLVKFASEHDFVAESGYGVGEYEGADSERVELVLDFIELTFSHLQKRGENTRKPDAPFPTHEAEVVIDDMVLVAGRMRGQGIRYYLRELQEQAEFERPQIALEELVAAG